MQNPCQIILRSCLIHFLGTVSTDYLSQLIPIDKCSPLLIPNRSPTTTTPWSLTDFYHYCYRIVCPSTWGITQSHPEMKFLSPTEMLYGRHEQGGIGINGDRILVPAVEERFKNLGTIVIPSIIITLKSDFKFKIFSSSSTNSQWENMS